MSESVFFKVNSLIIGEELKSKLIDISKEINQSIYVINQPLGANFEENRYDFEQGVIILIPGYKIMILNAGEEDEENFEYFKDDFIEDLGALSSKYEYLSKIGRPRKWVNNHIEAISELSSVNELSELIKEAELTSDKEKRISELLISLLTGSINDINNIDLDEPYELLDKIKQKIVLFDGDQTQFIYESLPTTKNVSIQGLSGTGKTEMLLHKVKELYTRSDSPRIAFTCYSKVLARNLQERVPDFFTFMKVGEQIKWNERLFVFHSWGSQKYVQNAGLYSTICKIYNIPFYTMSSGNFDTVCKRALADLNDKADFEPYFDYLFIDESQDFPDSFFDLCNLVTKNTVFAAGDMFQTIFDRELHKQGHNFLLNKCYRTHPQTLMFAQAVGLGLLERPVINWIGDSGFEACGYIIDKSNSDYNLKRRSIRRFGSDSDLDNKYQPVTLYLNSDVNNKVIDIIKDLRENNPTIKPKDIGIVFIDSGKHIYNQINSLKFSIKNEFSWESYISYEDVYDKEDCKVFISNKNNVKGLEFPFLICVSSEPIATDPFVRNALYMALTRSFISTYLVLSEENEKLFDIWQNGLNQIYRDKYLSIKEPEKKDILSEIQLKNLKGSAQSLADIKEEAFQKYSITNPILKKELSNILNAQYTLNSKKIDKNDIEKTIEFHLGLVSDKGGGALD